MKVVSFCTGNLGKTPVIVCELTASICCRWALLNACSFFFGSLAGMTHGGGQTRLALLGLDGDTELRSQAAPRKFKIMQLYSL